jgi:ParB/RepB/Spo0J family partition protein
MAIKMDGIVGRGDQYRVDPRIIVVQDGWNPRTDFSGQDELKLSIIENGVRQPLRVKKQDNRIILIDGERRLRATLQAIAEGHAIESVPAIFERNGVNDIEAMFTALITNEGKPLDPVEEATAFYRLQNWGVSVGDIARRMGKSESHVRNRLALVDAAPELKAAIQAKQVGTVDAVKIVKESGGNIEAQTKAIPEAKAKREAGKANRAKAQGQPEEVKRLNKMVDLSARAVKAHLVEKYEAGKRGFDTMPQPELWNLIRDKANNTGDPVDIIALAAMIHYQNNATK